MNERIKLLAEQASLELFNDTAHHRLLKGFAEKFAELIVKECMEEVMTYQHHTNPTREMVPFIVEDIKQHFGVEE